MDRLALLTLATVCVCTILAAKAGGGTLLVWPVDPHVKIFGDAEPPRDIVKDTGEEIVRAAPGFTETVSLRAARNEYECGQIAVRATRQITGLRVELSPLTRKDAKGTIGGEHLTWSFVGFIPLKRNTRDADTLRVRAAPCRVPDPLLEQRTLDVEANSTQPVWLTVRVPRDAEPGTYQGTVAVVAGAERVAVPIVLTVYPFALPDERHLLATNWFSTGRIATAHKVKAWSDAFWTLLERYARDMAEHRQNVFVTPWTLIDVTREPDGKLSFDYGRFDRYVETFLEAGVDGGIELRHVGHFGEGGWSSTEIVLRTVAATDRKTGQRVRLGPEEGLAPLLAALQRHL
ncbi:MAG: glycoside hydrolase domain-containing protein, partial [Planctomycetota bacterium]